MSIELIHGDALKKLANFRLLDLVITSPPYGIGKEYEKWGSFDEYLEFLHISILELTKTVRQEGVVAIQTGYFVDNHGFLEPIDQYVHEFMSLCDWTGSFRLLNRIVWHFGHGLHCKKRLSGRHEVVSVYSRSKNHTFNLDHIRVPQKYPNKKHYKGPRKGKLSGNRLGKNPGDVWGITNVKNNHPEKTLHPCQFPEALCERLIKAYSNAGDIVIDPFMGSGTAGAVAKKLGRKFIGIEKDLEYYEIAKKRIQSTSELI